ncbi:Fpg/Nei family DNA glycosylase [Peribacillus sp. SCS-155]|uniref:Fpg/Nei family DNA glycosylase n=1 Tax=Peribacillus sedimenti TaxID=3115297 RepID=UPI003906C485
MPELPEMENYKNLLTDLIVSRTITGVQINREKSINVPPISFKGMVEQQMITDISRRAKHLIFHLQNGNALLLHLMLGGWIYFGTDQDKPDRTVQVQLDFGHQSLYFIGLRLGYLDIHDSLSLQSKLSDLGPEPLDNSFTEEVFRGLVKRKRGIIKTSLVDQHFIAGIGNCYADEISYHARILPARSINSLSDTEVSQLYHSIRFILSDSANIGGYMENPLFKGDSKTGKYDDLCKVYDREGEPCERCGSNIILKKLSSRKVFFCNGCQR